MATEKEILLIEIRADGARVVKRSLGDIGKSADKATDAATQLKTILGGLITSRVIKDVIMLSDAYANLLNRLRVVTGSQFELNRAMEGVFKITRETRTALEGNVDMYARVALNTKKMGFAMQDVLRFSKQLNHAVILSGVTAREAQWGMVQFSQALAAGALRGDELRAVMEQLPVVTDVITKHMGITRGELRKLAFEGRVTSQVVIEAFQAAEKELADRFAKRIPTLDQGLTVLRSSFIRFIGEQDQAWQGTSTLAQMLLWAADNMENLGRFAQIAGTVLGGILLTNTVKLIAQWKILSLSILRTHGLLVLFATAITAIVVYADKIKLSANETATLADAVRALGPEFTAAGQAAEGFIQKIGDKTGIQSLSQEIDITLEGVLITMGRWADTFVGIITGSYFVIKNSIGRIADVIMEVLQHIGAFFTAIFRKFKLNMAAWKSALIAMAGAAKQALAGNVEAAKSFANIAQAALAKGGSTGIVDLYRQEAEGIVKVFGTEGKSAGEAFREGLAVGGTDSEDMVKRVIARAKSAASARNEGGLTSAVDEGALTPQQVELMKKVNGGIEQTTARMADLNVLMDKGRITTEQYGRAMTELKIKMLSTATDVGSGFKRGFMELSLDISNFSDVAQKTVTNAFKGMEDALVSFVTTGKVDFKSMVDSMLSDLTRLLARQLIVKALGSLGGGGDGALSQLFSAAAPQRAAGGPVSPGQPYVINEHAGGPREVFIAGDRGHVVNNREASAASPAEQQPIVVYSVWSKEDIYAAMGDATGQRIIVTNSPGQDAQKR